MSDAPGTGQNRPESAAGRHRKGAVSAAAVALASGLTVKAAAKKATVGERTLRRWAKHPKFKALVNQLREEMVGSAVGVLSQNMTDAATALVRLLKSKSEATRLKSSRSVLELTAKFRDFEEVLARLERLEQDHGKWDRR